MKSKDLESGSAESKIKGSENDDSGNVHYDGQVLHKTGNEDTNPVAENNSSKSPSKRKKLSTQQRGRKYILRSSGDGVRVLRPRSNAKCKIQAEPVTNPVNPVTKRRKKGRKLKTTTDEYSMARKRIRYLLKRMSYEQNLIDAYAGEGWKGQSAEKIRPEKELERAKSEILRCKLRIRELFRHLDSLSSEGRFQESLFDSEGQIDSEDIFCANCGLIDVSADNDIILCDGICDRGFHQKCLKPPLLSADIPVGDEGWLCPACDCKVDCIDLLNESQASDISVEDTWEKVFPEAASIVNGDKQCDDLPSDDSEDNEYDPDLPEADDHEDEEDHEEESDSEESEFTNSAEDSDAPECPKQIENFGLPSDDSEDDDFNPDVPDPDEVIQKDGSCSDESEFTSDSDDFCKELSKTSVANEDSASSLLKSKRCVENTDDSALNSEVLSAIDGDLNKDNVLPSGKRQIERLDYKKLHDETYGKSSSDSSEDEDWLESADISTPKKRKKDDTREGSHVLSKENARNIQNKRSSRSDAHNPMTNAASKSVIGQPHKSQLEGEVTPLKTPLNNTVKVGEEHHGFQESDSNVNKSSLSVNRRLGTIASQKLYECFQENQYPTRKKKESLAQELGLMIRQVDKWFTNARHSYRVTVKESSQAGGASPDKGNKSSNPGENNKQMEDVVGVSGKGKKPAPSKNSEVRADEGNSLDKGKNSAPARNSEVGAENGSKSDDAPGQSSSIEEGNEKKKVPSSRSKVGAEHGDGKDNNMEVAKDRQKAIARELRRMKQRR
ncbi:homeobox protein HOX1A-like [Iris pallida]|uniref:Homeobox protein HOX1A-like n=1 Tax=Iris pallida TaxID=29817 RepID=A0AAX6DUQ1_IRIPA|nr:homeobox protein HOX1A-like [Iris pallida]KAJ6835349.1 homeobox protein HOX1A-like [Iris pallida]